MMKLYDVLASDRKILPLRLSKGRLGETTLPLKFNSPFS